MGAQLLRPDIKQSSIVDSLIRPRTNTTPTIAKLSTMINPISAAVRLASASGSRSSKRLFISLPKGRRDWLLDPVEL